jgi:hypothetical protein
MAKIKKYQSGGRGLRKDEYWKNNPRPEYIDSSTNWEDKSEFTKGLERKELEEMERKKQQFQKNRERGEFSEDVYNNEIRTMAEQRRTTLNDKYALGFFNNPEPFLKGSGANEKDVKRFQAVKSNKNIWDPMANDGFGGLKDKDHKLIFQSDANGDVSFALHNTRTGDYVTGKDGKPVQFSSYTNDGEQMWGSDMAISNEKMYADAYDDFLSKTYYADESKTGATDMAKRTEPTDPRSTEKPTDPNNVDYMRDYFTDEDKAIKAVGPLKSEDEKRKMAKVTEAQPEPKEVGLMPKMMDAEGDVTMQDIEDIQTGNDYIDEGQTLVNQQDGRNITDLKKREGEYIPQSMRKDATDMTPPMPPTAEPTPTVRKETPTKEDDTGYVPQSMRGKPLNLSPGWPKIGNIGIQEQEPKQEPAQQPKTRVTKPVTPKTDTAKTEKGDYTPQSQRGVKEDKPKREREDKGSDKEYVPQSQRGKKDKDKKDKDKDVKKAKKGIRIKKKK